MELWWPAATAALKNEDTGGPYVFFDEVSACSPGSADRRPDSSARPRPQPRNTRQIASSFSTLAPIRMRLGDVDGPDVRFVECAPDEALEVADDQVDVLLDEGWREEDLAL